MLEIKPYETIWLREMERRIKSGLPCDPRQMMVGLKDDLPRGFQPTEINPRLLFQNGPSAEGLLAVGDSEGLLPDVERAALYIRDRLVKEPDVSEVTAIEVSESLGVLPERTERVLAVLASMGAFMTQAYPAASGGFSRIGIQGNQVVAAYLGFQGIAETLDRLEGDRTPPAPSAAGVPRDVVALKRNTAFILMSMDPQDDTLTDVCNTIKAACAEFGIQAQRVDDIEHQERITDRVLENIASAEFVIADLTGERPNVYYEVGYAHALEKRPILLRKRGTRLHFDLSVHNAPEYRNLTELTSILRRRFEAILGRSPPARQ